MVRTDTREVFLDFIGQSLGENTQSIESAHNRGWLKTDPSVLRESGFNQHHFASTDSTPYTYALAACKESMHLSSQANPRIAAAEIDCVLYATCITENGNIGDRQTFLTSGDVKPLMDFPVSHLQADLELTNAFVAGLNQTACTSLLVAIRFAKALLLAEQNNQHVLCVTADRFPEGAYYEQVYNIISDGAASCLVTTVPSAFKILACHQITNGAMVSANDDETAGFYFNYTVNTINETLARAGKTINDLDWIVPQNTFQKAWQVMSSFLRVSCEQVLMPTRPDIGHCISGDNLMNLKAAQQLGVFKRGDLIILPMAGFGLNWSCILLEYCL